MKNGHDKDKLSIRPTTTTTTTTAATITSTPIRAYMSGPSPGRTLSGPSSGRKSPGSRTGSHNYRHVNIAQPSAQTKATSMSAWSNKYIYVSGPQPHMFGDAGRLVILFEVLPTRTQATKTWRNSRKPAGRPQQKYTGRTCSLEQRPRNGRLCPHCADCCAKPRPCPEESPVLAVAILSRPCRAGPTSCGRSDHLLNPIPAASQG